MESISIALAMMMAVVVSGVLVRMLPVPIPLPLVQIALGALIAGGFNRGVALDPETVSYTRLRAHETLRYLVCSLLLEKKNSTSRMTHSA